MRFSFSSLCHSLSSFLHSRTERTHTESPFSSSLLLIQQQLKLSSLCATHSRTQPGQPSRPHALTQHQHNLLFSCLLTNSLTTIGAPVFSFFFFWLSGVGVPEIRLVKGRILQVSKLHMELETWEVVHIPNKPQIAPNQQPTVNVLAAVIEPKLTNTLIRRLNQIAPLENLRHVKRVQKKRLEGGKIQLLVILCVASEESNESCSMPHDVQDLINSYQLSVFKTKVCQYAALSKEEWEEQCKLWPTSYHPPTYNIDGITGFSHEDSQSIFIFMNMAIRLAKSGSGSVVNAAVIVDPMIKQVVATAHDQVCSWDIEADKSSLQTNCLGKPVLVSCKASPSTCLQDETKQSYTGVSCLYPWGWAEQQPVHSSGGWHPLSHAAMVAVESSAARDRLLFPSLGEMQNTPIDFDNKQDNMGSSAKKQKTNIEKITGNGIKNSCEEDSHSLSARPYLCTGYDIYLVWEPCTMCAMALVHQRLRRIFYAFPNPNAGALGSVHRLQGERSLNHHYAVFRVMVPEQVLDRAHLT